MDVVTFENLEVFEDIRKMQRISARKEHVRETRNFVKLLDVQQTMLQVENSSYTNTFKVELEVDRLLFIPLVPTPLVVDEELNKTLYVSHSLYIRILRFQPYGADIAATRNKDYSTRRALAFGCVFLSAKVSTAFVFDDYPKQQPGNFQSTSNGKLQKSTLSQRRHYMPWCAVVLGKVHIRKIFD